ncbi:DUF6174 domain-containing protein [Rubrivirga sp. IMCC45206]|uniref:DUF6174 domain-containing protein n=1 Tax=Rubrivirga sp. IMCC45206 TaxID=3391614 RepID=UPI003990397F
MSRIPLLAAALALTLAACDSTGDDWPFPGSEIDAAVGVEVADAAALADLRAEWVASRPDGYWLRYETICFCAPLVTDVRVIGGEIAEVRINGEAAPEDPGPRALTVLGLYDQAVQAYADADYALARVRPGTPPLLVSLSVDDVFEIADEEVSYRVVAYAPLEVAAN